MTSSDIKGRNPVWRCALATAITMALASTAHAQQAQNQDEEETDEAGLEEILVTGSRLKRDTFSSISPLQVITGEVSREAGLIDASSILQESSASAGQQIDLTFNGFVLDNGPGAQTVSLRGLGDSRTLVLLNGRRIAPGGVEGAPSAPDLNMIPSSLVDQYEILQDGASSIYGSDAVAGVVNAILRQDFDGLEVENFTTINEDTGGNQNTFAAAWGKNFDRGFIGFGLEHANRDRVKRQERDWTQDCATDYEITTNGEIRTQALADSRDWGFENDNGCFATRNVARYQAAWGSWYYQPGAGNVTGDFSDFFLPGTIGADANGDGRTDGNSVDFSLNRIGTQTADLFNELETISAMAYGEYSFEGEMNITPFFELLYTNRKTDADSGERAQLFPFVPPSNPFNPCGVNGIDCGEAYSALLNNPNIVAQYQARFGGTPEQLGIVPGATGPLRTRPIVRVTGDRNKSIVDVDQIRAVAGIRGDLPQLNFGSLNNWSFEVAGVFSESEGSSFRPGIRGDLLNLTLNTTIEDPNNPGSFICGIDGDGDGIPDGTDGCVPVNLFAPSLYQGLVGDFATQAERDFLFDNRDFDTKYEQVIFSTFASGNIFELPAGQVAVGLGFDYRDDKIESIPDAVARDGLFFGFFADGGAVGSKDTREVYGEIELPLLANQPFAEQLDLNLSARNTKDEFYGSEWTYAAKIGWRPVSSLLIRGTYGTSYRAPNLRENFLLSQTGFQTLFDPCSIPETARDELSGGYDPGLDTRDPTVLANCLANGVDPTTFFANANGSYSVEVSAGGSTTLNEETSDSLSVGFSFDQPWFESFDMSLGMTYYEIDIDDTIIEPSSTFIIDDCYNNVGNNSVFCSRIARDGDGFIDFIDRGFINRDNESIRGVDVNLRLDKDVTMFSRPVGLTADINMNHPIEVSDTFIGAGGQVDFDNDRGEFGFPSWQGSIDLRAEFSDFRATWRTRYIGSVRADLDNVEDFSDADDSTGTGFIGDTCAPEEGVLCRNVDFADEYFNHTASLYYNADTWSVGVGVSNVFNESPPQVDVFIDEVTVINNTPVGYGYDLQGRRFFLNASVNFANF